MSTEKDYDPLDQPVSTVPVDQSAGIEDWPSSGTGSAPDEFLASSASSSVPEARLLFQSFTAEPPISLPRRIPNLGDLLLLVLFAALGFMVAGILSRAALHLHFFGISNEEKASADIHYILTSMTALYLTIVGASALVFPFLWHKGLLAGLEWNLATAWRLRWKLVSASCLCFVLALIDEMVLPGPSHAPIDKLFQSPVQAWLLFAYGVSLAPFFEEMIFRGFLLPALSTAFDWTVEQFTGNQPPAADEDGDTRWSISAMVTASVLTSIPFALMHAEQTGWSLGPFLLLVSVSLILCCARLATRSLAASVFVHATYNFLLFSVMMLGTSGFRHFDKL
jgi:membrane protease YdiL (CAAX protease family)